LANGDVMLIYLVSVLVLVAMPGPDQALITRSSLVGGSRVAC
jgi:threonine/homoserine/homoserine lactone efflux protein